MLMSEEEKEAKRRLESFINYFSMQWDKDEEGSKKLFVDIKDIRAIKIMLNLIKNQQSEIQKLEISNYKQSKTINLMAEKINESYFDKNNFELWFEKEIYPKNNCISDRIFNIKEYFKWKSR